MATASTLWRRQIRNWVARWLRRKVRPFRHRPLAVFRLEDRLAPAVVGLSVAVGDLDGDGYLDAVTGAGPGGGSHVRAFSGRTGEVLHNFFAYDPFLRGGVNVAVGDVDADGYDDIVTGASVAGGPHVKAFSGRDGSVLRSVFALDPSLRGGVSVAAGDVTGDGRVDIVAGAGPGGPSVVAILDGVTGTAVRSFNAYSPNFTGGVWVAAVDLTGDGVAAPVVRHLAQHIFEPLLAPASALRQVA